MIKLTFLPVIQDEGLVHNSRGREVNVRKMGGYDIKEIGRDM